jgi:hypothetical protein
MAQVSKPTRVVEKASTNIMKALNRAKGSLADIPLGEKRLDPRTEKKRAQAEQTEPIVDTTLSRLLYELRNQPNQQENQQ